MDDLNSLWEKHLRERTTESRNNLLLAYSDLIGKMCISRIMPSFMGHLDDTISYATIELLRYIDNWKKSEAPSKSEITGRIVGYLIDYFRKEDVLGRRDRRRINALSRATSKFEAEKERLPSYQELADELGITEGEVVESYGLIGRSRLVSLSSIVENQEPWENGVLKAMEDKEFEIKLRDIMEHFSFTEREILKDTMKGVPHKYTARRLRISGARVSQIYSRNIKPRIKELLERRVTF
jgi:RNA polymerase sigma factor (sigma-70 family)